MVRKALVTTADKAKGAATRSCASAAVAFPACGFRFTDKVIRLCAILSSVVRYGKIEYVIEQQLATASDAQLLASVVELEAELTRLRYRQLSVLAELNSRNVPGTQGF